MFCPKCGSILKPKISEKGESENFCSCGYSEKSKKERIIKEKINNEKDKIFVHENINPIADFEHVCEKCGFNKAYIEQKELAKCETWARCEPNRVEIICGKCGFRRRLE